MPLTDAERQKKYRERMVAEGKKRYQVVMPGALTKKVDDLCSHWDCTKSELFTRLVEAEWKNRSGTRRK